MGLLNVELEVQVGAKGIQTLAHSPQRARYTTDNVNILKSVTDKKYAETDPSHAANSNRKRAYGSDASEECASGVDPAFDENTVKKRKVESESDGVSELDSVLKQRQQAPTHSNVLVTCTNGDIDNSSTAGTTDEATVTRPTSIAGQAESSQAEASAPVSAVTQEVLGAAVGGDVDVHAHPHTAKTIQTHTIDTAQSLSANITQTHTASNEQAHTASNEQAHTANTTKPQSQPQPQLDTDKQCDTQTHPRTPPQEVVHASDHTKALTGAAGVTTCEGTQTHSSSQNPTEVYNQSNHSSTDQQIGDSTLVPNIPTPALSDSGDVGTTRTDAPHVGSSTDGVAMTAQVRVGELDTTDAARLAGVSDIGAVTSSTRHSTLQPLNSTPDANAGVCTGTRTDLDTLTATEAVAGGAEMGDMNAQAEQTQMGHGSVPVHDADSTTTPLNTATYARNSESADVGGSVRGQATTDAESVGDRCASVRSGESIVSGGTANDGNGQLTRSGMVGSSAPVDDTIQSPGLRVQEQVTLTAADNEHAQTQVQTSTNTHTHTHTDGGSIGTNISNSEALAPPSEPGVQATTTGSSMIGGRTDVSTGVQGLPAAAATDSSDGGASGQLTRPGVAAVVDVNTSITAETNNTGGAEGPITHPDKPPGRTRGPNFAGILVPAEAVEMAQLRKKDREEKPRKSVMVVKWLMDNYEMWDNHSIPRQSVYDKYEEYSKVHDLGPCNNATFGKLIRSIFPNLKTRRLGTRGNSKYHYYGIKEKDASSAPHQPRNGTHPASLYPVYHIRQQGPMTMATLEEAQEFVHQHTAHCMRVLERFASYSFEAVGHELSNFWSNLTPTILNAYLTHPEAKRVVAANDALVLQNTILTWFPSPLSMTRSQKLKSTRLFAKVAKNVLMDPIECLCKTDVYAQRLVTAEYFSRMLLRLTSLTHLAQAALSLLYSGDQVAQMIADWKRIDVSGVLWQAKEYCVCSFQTLQDLRVGFESVLNQRGSLPMWTAWIETILATHIHKRVSSHAQSHTHSQAQRHAQDTSSDHADATHAYTRLPTHAHAHTHGDEAAKEEQVSAKVFLGLFGLVGSMLIRNLTVKSAKSFGSFHLLRLLLDEYLTYLVERDETLPTTVSPLVAWPVNGLHAQAQPQPTGGQAGLPAHIQNTTQQQQQLQQQQSGVHARTHGHGGGYQAHAHAHMRGYDGGPLDYRTGLPLGTKGMKRETPVKLIPRPMMFPTQHPHMIGVQNQYIQPQPVGGGGKEDGGRRGQTINEESESSVQSAAHTSKQQRGDRIQGTQKNGKPGALRNTHRPKQNKPVGKQQEQTHTTKNKNVKQPQTAPTQPHTHARASQSNNVKRLVHEGQDQHTQQEQQQHTQQLQQQHLQKPRHRELGHAEAHTQQQPHHETYAHAHTVHTPQSQQQHRINRTYSASDTASCANDNNNGRTNDGERESTGDDVREKNEMCDNDNGLYSQGQMGHPPGQYSEEDMYTTHPSTHTQTLTHLERGLHLRSQDSHSSHTHLQRTQESSPETKAFANTDIIPITLTTRGSESTSMQGGSEDTREHQNKHTYRVGMHMYDDMAHNGIAYGSESGTHIQGQQTYGNEATGHGDMENSHRYAVDTQHVGHGIHRRKSSRHMHPQSVGIFPHTDNVSNEHNTQRAEAHSNEMGSDPWRDMQPTHEQRRGCGDFNAETFPLKSANEIADNYLAANDHFRRASTVSSGTNVVPRLN
ncbi:hypothetical protein SARC_09097 [Sphaeroforma arctica JP610]|uniref:RFX-type winged-helix domain-containing protein n=1 Tax=Sphaeroforma arctica JP610 TaxID=667725 RepID=A0A0L0FPN1_9EUKA|nr:hypothetical protein SARC_09097 [Sphaeroforma arctica JP610]KNC78471.1 hypothetical protein SARC_09097 [Sphaeroforma arctica JP610]|eukprot:XP_014152373.1 hypothetical protein SARC_09097 [Sphaeroforma arctica JP610]